MHSDRALIEERIRRQLVERVLASVEAERRPFTITAGPTDIAATASESGAHEALPVGTRVDEFRIDGLRLAHS